MLKTTLTGLRSSRRKKSLMDEQERSRIAKQKYRARKRKKRTNLIYTTENEK
jgi:hypothetical protein